MPPIDCLVVGAGPAGLTAGLYLARFRRQATVFDGGQSRAQWIPMARNIAAWPEGITGGEFLSRARVQAEGYGARFEAANVIGLEATGDDGFEAVLEDGRRLRARTVILTTGVAEVEPPFPAFDEGVRRGVVNLCPICDGFEAQGKRLAVLGSGQHGAAEALFLRTYAQRIDLYTTGSEPIPDEILAWLDDARVTVRPAALDRIAVEAQGVRVDGEFYDRLYSALGVRPRHLLAERLGARLDEDGRLVVDSHQATTVDGLYAAGDLVRGLNQISVAMAEAAIAATAVHNRLPPRYA
jgi:thioredoxin reductase (NADPH)